METAQQDTSARAYEPAPEINVDTGKIASVIEQQQSYKEQNINEIFDQIDENMWKQFGLDVANDVIMTGLMFGVGYAASGLLNHNLKKPVKAYKYNDGLSLDKNIEEFMKSYEKSAQYINGEIDKVMYDGFTNDLKHNQIDPTKYKKISQKEYTDRLNNISYQQSQMNISKENMIKKIQEIQQKQLQESATRHRIDLGTLNKQVKDLNTKKESIEKSIADQNKLIQESTNSITEKQGIIDKLKQEIEKKQENLQSYKSDKKNELRRIDIDKVDAKEKIDTANKEIEQAKKKQEDIQNKVEVVEKQKKDLQMEQRDNSKKERELRDEIIGIKQQYAEEIDAWLNEFEEGTVTEEYRNQLKDYNNNNAYRKDELIKFWGKENAEELLEIRKNYQLKDGYGLTAKKKQHTDIKSIIGENTQKIQKIDNALNNGKALIEQADQTIQQHKNTIQQANKDLQLLQEQEKATQNVIKSTEQSVADKIKSLQEEIDKFQSNITEYTVNRDKLLQQQNDLQNTLKDTKRTIDNINQTLQSGEIVNLQKRINELSNSKYFSSNDTMTVYDGTMLSGLEDNEAYNKIVNTVKDEAEKVLKKSVSPRAFNGYEQGQKLEERERKAYEKAREELHTNQFNYRQTQMQDIFKSLDENMNDMRGLINDQYINIKEDINRLFDTRTLPLPEEYITPKNQINWSNYKQDFNDFYDYKIKQYPSYDRKRYQKYDVPLIDDNEIISEIDQKWLKDNKPAYQLDLLKDTLRKGNTVDIKELSQLLGDYKPQTVIKQTPMNKQYNTVLSEIRNAESELKNAQAALDKLQGEKATLEKAIEQQIDPLIQEQIEKLTEPIKNAQIEKNQKQTYYNDRVGQKNKIDSNYRALRNLFDRGPSISELRYNFNK